jgi:membrane fusion protein, copper/silver efflux system
MKRWTSKRNIALAAAALVVTFLLGTWFGGDSEGVETDTHDHSAHAEDAAAEAAPSEYTCSMHPNIRQPNPGQCPLCGMDLIPVASGDGEDRGPRELKLSASARKLAEIVTTPVERRSVSADVRMVGKIAYDETRLRRITAWFPGRLERLFVDYTGIPVKKGDHMVVVFSPELITAQRELIEAKRATSTLSGSGLASIHDMAKLTLEASREKLRLWGLTRAQIRRIERRGRTDEKITIFAPMSGIVVRKDAQEGMYVQTGSPIYTIADLTQLWLNLDAYESDLSWLRYGQDVSFVAEAYPGRTFQGRISFVSPILDPKTRTVKVRVNVPNEDGALKPDMFVRAVVSAAVMGEGRVFEPDLAGKWMCPMHPEIVADEPGKCSICEMPLVRTESLGFVAPEEAAPPLVIPVSAALITGKRSLVYVADPDEEGVYEGREVVLGPRAGASYIVLEGLEEGDRVVSHGNFKIDSAVQLMAGPSMMNPEGGGPTPGHNHGGHGEHTATTETKDAPAPPPERAATPAPFRAALSRVFDAYYLIHKGLSADSLPDAQAGATAFVSALGGVDMKLVKGAIHVQWMKDLSVFDESAKALAGAADIKTAREAFDSLSNTAILAAYRYGADERTPILRFHCPMAFDNRGADWLQGAEPLLNPYFGAAMLRCGVLKETIQGAGASEQGAEPSSSHEGAHDGH